MVKKKASVNMEQELKGVFDLMDEIMGDRSVPKNIRGAVERAKNKIVEKAYDVTSYSTAMYELDDISADINMPEHTRTTIWEINSEIERVRELIKQ